MEQHIFAVVYRLNVEDQKGFALDATLMITAYCEEEARRKFFGTPEGQNCRGGIKYINQIG